MWNPKERIFLPNLTMNDKDIIKWTYCWRENINILFRIRILSIEYILFFSFLGFLVGSAQGR